MLGGLGGCARTPGEEKCQGRGNREIEEQGINDSLINKGYKELKAQYRTWRLVTTLGAQDLIVIKEIKNKETKDIRKLPTALP
eukprot:951383-Pelagomonas_calceolata.AAC.3